MISNLPISKLQPGQTLEKTIYDKSGRLLLRAGTALTIRHLQLMQDWELDRVPVSGGRPMAPADLPAVHVIDLELQDELTKAIEEVFTSVAVEKALDVDRIAGSLTPLVHEVATHRTVTLDLAGLRKKDNYTFMHSLSVGVLSVAAGVELGMKENDLLALSVASVMHDIGKMLVPLEVLNKPGKLTPDEWAMMKRHPRLGVEFLSERSGLSTSVLQAIYQHHERVDGTGYPHTLSASDISIFGRIIAAADVYDAMTSDRVYRPGVSPHLAVEQLIAESKSSFDTEIVQAFIRSLAVYPVGSLVEMDNGQKGRVLGYDRNVPHRPRVQLLSDESGTWLAEPLECDLMRELTRFVKAIHRVR